MKKFNTSERVTIGMDISDRSCHVVALYEEDGEIAWEGKLTTRGAALQKFFSQVGPASRSCPWKRVLIRGGFGDYYPAWVMKCG